MLVGLPTPFSWELSTERFRAFGPDPANLFEHGRLYRVFGGREVEIAPADGGVAIDTAGSSFDTHLGVYTGDSVSGLSHVASHDSLSYEVRTSRVAFRVAAGTTYRIRVGSGYYGGSGAFNLRLTHRTPPANDAFAAATPLPPAASRESLWRR